VVLLSFFLGAVWPTAYQSLLGSESGREQFFVWMLLPFAMVLDAAIYAAFGNTPGKAIAGIRVRTLENERLGFGPYVRRNFGVWWAGMGTGFPLIALFTLASAHTKASKLTPLRWERSTHSRVLDSGASLTRTTLTAIVYIAAVAGLVVLGVKNKDQKKPTTSAPAQSLLGELHAAADEVNRHAPTMVDAETRLDRASEGPGPSFTYHYTLLKLDLAKFAPGEYDRRRAPFQSELRKRVCGSTEMAGMLNAGVAVYFAYLDHAGRDAGTYSVTKQSCAGG
jgi:hypothetical protein